MAETTALITAIGELVKAVAPYFITVVLAVYFWSARPAIPDLTRRLRKGKFLGQEFELRDELDQLKRDTEKGTEPALALPPSADTKGTPQTHTRTVAASVALSDERYDAVRNVLKEAASSPRAALMLLSADIERALRDLFAEVFGSQSDLFPMSLMADRLREPVLNDWVVKALRDFTRIRNRIVHGDEASDEDVLRAIDSGATLLTWLRTALLLWKHEHRQGEDPAPPSNLATATR